MNVRLRNHFLIAMPGMEDSIFAHSITYLCEHNEHGAMWASWSTGRSS